MLKKIQNKLSVSRKKVSKEWSHYRSVKLKVKDRKTLSKEEKKQILASELDLTRGKISKYWQDYKETKYSILHKSPYSGLSFSKTQVGLRKEVDGEEHFFRFHKTYQKIYKAKKGYNVDNLDKVIPKIFEDKQVQGALVVFEIYSKETDTRQVISNYITPDLLEVIQEQEYSIFEYVTSRFAGYGDYELKIIYIRVIYKKKS